MLGISLIIKHKKTDALVGFNTMYFKNKIYLFRYFKIKKGTLAKITVDAIITQKEVVGIVRKR